MRRTWWTDAVEAAGCSAYTVYNRMLLPAAFAGTDVDCAHLKRAVQVWDVACERQVEIAGPDADALMQRLTPRDMGRIAPDRCAYVPICNVNGGMLNDPRGASAPAGALGGSRSPTGNCASGSRAWRRRADTTCASVRRTCSRWPSRGRRRRSWPPASSATRCATWGVFRHRRLAFQWTDMLVSRTGYSKQGGFEVYVEDEGLAMPLWDALMAAGADLDVPGPGARTWSSGSRAGMLSYGNDMTDRDTPFELGLDKYVQRFDCIGGDALQRHVSTRRIVPVEIDGPLPVCDRLWPVMDGDRRAGHVSSAAHSLDHACGVAIAMIDRAWEPGARLTVRTQDGPRDAVLRDRFWA